MLSSKWFIVLSLILSIQNPVFADYDIIDAVSDVAVFFPTPPFLFLQAINIWQQYKKISALWSSAPQSSTEKQLEEVLSKMEQMEMEIYKVQESIQRQLMNLLPMEIQLDNKLKDIYHHIGKIDHYFHLFLLYSNTSQKHENETIRKFRDTLIDPSEIGMGTHFPEIFRLVMNVDDNGADVIATLADQKHTEDLRCKREQSSLQLINNLYNHIMLAEVKGLLMIHYAYSLYRQPYDTRSFRTELREYVVDAWERVSLLIPKFKRYMRFADRDIWKCDPSIHSEGATYIKLDPIFNKVIIKSWLAFENRTFFGRQPSGRGSCADIQEHDESHCAGIVRGCWDTNDTDIYTCLAEPGSNRRYKYVELKGTKKVYGKKVSSCPRNEKMQGHHWEGDWYEYELCWCTCEEYNTRTYRYFSLKAVTSDLENNKVITGVRFAKAENVIQVQIQQGELREYGNIAQRTVDWKPLEPLNPLNKSLVNGRDYHKIIHNSREVNLDSIDAPANCSLTGLKFMLENGALKLAIQYTPIDFRSGTLIKNETKWLTIPSGDKHRRPEIKFKNDLPLNRFNMPMINHQKSRINFTASSLEADLGSSVVPYIDSQEITSTPAVMLSGAGLVYKGANYSSGFITMKLHTYKYGEHLHVEPSKSEALEKFLRDYDKKLDDLFLKSSAKQTQQEKRYNILTEQDVLRYAEKNKRNGNNYLKTNEVY